MYVLKNKVSKKENCWIHDNKQKKAKAEYELCLKK